MESEKLFNKWRAAFSIGIGLLCIGLDFAMVNTVLAAIQRDLDSSMLQLQWIMNIFVLVLCVLIVASGRVSADVGRKRMLMMGLAVFGCASLGAGLSESSGWLIFFRALQGLAAAISIPASQVLMAGSFPEVEKGKALGIWASVMVIGLALGPLIGGMVASLLNWRWIFFLYLPLIIISLVLMGFFVKESEEKVYHRKIDMTGLISLIIGISSLITGIIQGPEWGWLSPQVITLFVIAALALIILFGNEKRISYPIIPFNLFSNRSFMSSAVINFALLFFIWAALFFIPLYLHDIRNEVSYKVGFLLLLITLPLVFISPLLTHFNVKANPKALVITGFLCLIFALLIASQFGTATSLGWVILCFLLMGVGWGISWSPVATGEISHMSPEMMATASGGISTLQEIGGALGLAISGALFRQVNFTTAENLLEKEGLEEANVFKLSFIAGFSQVMWLVSAVCLAALIIAIFTLKKHKSEPI